MRKLGLFVSAALSLVLVLVTFMAVPMVSMQNATPVPAPTLTSVPLVAQQAGEVEVTFWYGLGGLLGNVVIETVNMYNDSQDVYYVNPVFQSSYDDTINRINAGLASGELPDLAQVFEAGSQRMIDTGRIIPVQTFFDRDGLQSVIDDMEPAVRANYTINGILQSAPFNSSTAMLFIDRAAFVAAGLNPDQTLNTFDEIKEYARALTVRDASGNVTRHGIGLYPEGWFFEQIHAAHEVPMGTPDNGITGRMEQYTYNDSIGVEWLEFMKSMVDEGTAIYFGTGGGNAANAAFTNGETSMTFSSIAGLRTLIAGAERAGVGVEVGTVFMPRRPDTAGKTIVGGASLWITDAGSTEAQEGAWDFIKWALTPEVQAFWASNTGYYPVVQASYETEIMQAALVAYPQFQVAIDQIRLSEIAFANTAHISGTFVSMRQDVITAIDGYLTGAIPTAQEALDIAVATSNELLTEYNSTVSN